MFILAQFATERPGRLRAMTARTRQFLPDVMDYLPERSITVCGKKNLTSADRPRFSGETRFAPSSAGGKTHKQAFLGLLRAGKGSIWWGQFRGLG